MDRLIEIRSDVFDIAKRAREIDCNYFIAYNPSKRRFEVHNRKTQPTLQLALPYESLDERTLRRIRETRMERKNELIEKINRENELKEEQAQRNALDTFSYKARSLVDYMQKSGGRLPDYEDI